VPLRIKRFLQNASLSAASLVVTFLFLEVVVFGSLLKPDDLLENVSINGVVRYKPDTKAVFRHPAGRETYVTINADGWNSLEPHYRQEKTPGRLRVAVIGDSYVHGAFINTEQGYPEILERALKRQGRNVEVLRFGMDGAPLSQYLNVLRKEVLLYEPDIVVTGLIHNDFDESYRFLKTRTGSSFMKLDISDDGSVSEIPASDFQPGLADKLRKSATFRYLYYETNLYLAAKSLVSKYFWGGDSEYAPEFISSAVDVRNIKDEKRNRIATEYVMGEMKALGAKHGFKLVFVMDGVREAIYAGRNPEEYAVYALNKTAKDVAAKLELPFLDLQDAFAADYAKYAKPLEFSYDWHWNARANRIAGKALAEFMSKLPDLLGPAATVSSPNGVIKRATNQSDVEIQ
jgi:hypothetical protein